MNVNLFNGLTIKPKEDFFDSGSVSQEKVANSKFIDILKDTFSQANDLKIQADNMTNDFLSGKTDNLHEVMITAQKSAIAISFVTEIRNKLLEAYQEFSRIQL